MPVLPSDDFGAAISFPAPNPQTPNQLESGEYFLSTAAKKEKHAAERSEDKKKEKEDRDKERAAVFVAPKEGKKKKRRADEVAGTRAETIRPLPCDLALKSHFQRHVPPTPPRQTVKSRSKTERKSLNSRPMGRWTRGSMAVARATTSTWESCGTASWQAAPSRTRRPRRLQAAARKTLWWEAARRRGRRRESCPCGSRAGDSFDLVWCKEVFRGRAFVLSCGSCLLSPSHDTTRLFTWRSTGLQP